MDRGLYPAAHELIVTDSDVRCACGLLVKEHVAREPLHCRIEADANLGQIAPVGVTSSTRCAQSAIPPGDVLQRCRAERCGSSNHD